MADEGTSSTLVLIAAIIQLIFFFVMVPVTALFVFTLAMLPTIPPYYFPPPMPPITDLMNVMLGVTILFGTMTALCLTFSILWFMWRSVPSQHKTGLIITGILGLLIAGVIPGILALIAGAIVPQESPAPSASVTAPPSKPAQPVYKDGVKYCSACGTPITNPNAQFCGVCGASLV
jgi:hypothetical protein